jgi:hypothetical protein
MTEGPAALVIGAGPAGLMAAEALAAAGHPPLVVEAKPSPARKFLMAGKSGLNITKDEDPAAFAAAYDAGWLAPILRAFGPAQVQDWARGLGQPVFTGSSGRVFPVAMKGSPLLRAWLARLDAAGVALRSRWRWTGFAPGGGLAFDTPEGPQTLRPGVTVLALGGASWARLGSDGAWVPWLRAAGVTVAPWKPANMGLAVPWSPHMARHFGQPVKGAALIAGQAPPLRAEFVVSARGLEGGGIYAVSRAVRDGAPLTLDLRPDLTRDALEARLASFRPGESTANRLRKLGLAPVAAALVMEWGRDLPLVQALKALPLRHTGPRPLDEAISTAGGIARAALTDGLELRALPGIFAAGEMLDWEAPTGGYLLTACLATGLHAGRAAAARLTPAAAPR